MTCHFDHVRRFSVHRRMTGPYLYHILDVVLFSLLVEQKGVWDDSSPNA